METRAPAPSIVLKTHKCLKARDTSLLAGYPPQPHIQLSYTHYYFIYLPFFYMVQNSKFCKIYGILFKVPKMCQAKDHTIMVENFSYIMYVRDVDLQSCQCVCIYIYIYQAYNCVKSLEVLKQLVIKMLISCIL